MTAPLRMADGPPASPPGAGLHVASALPVVRAASRAPRILPEVPHHPLSAGGPLGGRLLGGECGSLDPPERQRKDEHPLLQGLCSPSRPAQGSDRASRGCTRRYRGSGTQQPRRGFSSAAPATGAPKSHTSPADRPAGAVGGNWEGMGHRLREHLVQPVVASDPGAQMGPATGGAVPL
ncbi:hypothetical protein COCOBI_03-3230 [Coccomyxa sp. Obi]|nr:hypothetical protein COCOBI_03-3230 [Coccomyxa sp. Obi]